MAKVRVSVKKVGKPSKSKVNKVLKKDAKLKRGTNPWEF